MKSGALSSLVILVVGFLLFTLLNNLMFGGMRLDLTENGLYTLSDGTKEIISEIDEPINLYFFFSGKASEDLTALRTYAQRVRELLEEYKLYGGTKINLKIINPEPFSEEEDRAATFGLQGVPANQSGDELYFGLAGTNALDGQAVIPFFQPDKEEFLEYDITKLIHNLATVEKSTVGVYSNLEIGGSIDPRTFQPSPAWIFMTRLEELFAVKVLDDLSPDELETVDLLIVIHPKALDESGLFAIDQHVMNGGKFIAFVDPLAETDKSAAPETGMQGAASSNLNRLTSVWGVKLREDEILGDAQAALTVGGADGVPVRHLGIPGFTERNISRDDVVTALLENINMATVGILDIDMVEGVEARPLIVSSEFASPLPSLQFQFLSDPGELQKGFTPSGETYVTAVRVSGSAKTAFPEGIEGFEGELKVATETLQAVIVADTDLLSDRLWVQVQDFFGQQIVSAFADNGGFITNLVDNLSGSSALIDVRSRGQFSRPFVVVQNLRRQAEEKYLRNAEDLQIRLAETEQKLSELQSSQVEDGLLTLTPEQEEALVRFQDEKLKIRKQLRDVRHQLDRDMETLGAMLKLLNILLMPFVLIAILFVVRRFRPGRGKAVKEAGA